MQAAVGACQTFEGQDAGLPLARIRAVVKLTYRQQIPSVFKRLIEEFALSPKSASKYRLAVETLGLIPEREATSTEELTEPLPCLTY